MQFTPKTEQEIQEEGLLKNGIYPFEVVEASEEISKKGNPMIALKLKVFGPDEVYFIRDWLMEKIAYKLRHFCAVTNLIKKYEEGSLDAVICKNVVGYCFVEVKEHKEYGPQNVIRDYVPPPKSAETPKPLTDGDDDIPF